MSLLSRADVLPMSGARRALRGAAVLAIVCLHAGLSWHASWDKSLTDDESVYLAAGWSYWETGDFRLNREHPPLVKLWASAIPALLYDLRIQPADSYWWRAGQCQYARTAQCGFAREHLFRDGPEMAVRLTRLGRLPMIALSAAGGWVVFLWSRALWGGAGGMLSLALYALCPNVLGHGALMTNDLPVGIFLLLASFAAWQTVFRPRAWKPWSAGLALGAALISKYLALAVVPVFTALFAAAAARSARHGNGRAGRAGAKRLARDLAIIAGVAWFLTVAIFLWPPDFMAYWRNLGWLMSIHDTSKEFFFWGQYRQERSMLYFPAAFLLKTPLPTLILTIGALALSRRRDARPLAFLLLPAVALGALVMARAPLIGYRYLLPSVMALFPLAGGWLRTDRGWLAGRRWVAAGAVAWLAASTLRAHPNYLPWFNALALGGGERYLADSNVDWGQEAWQVARRAESEDKDRPAARFLWSYSLTPNLYGGPIQNLADVPHEAFFPLDTTYYISPNIAPRMPARWMDRFRPSGRVGDSISIYRFRYADGPTRYDARSGCMVVGFVDLLREGRRALEDGLAGFPPAIRDEMLQAGRAALEQRARALGRDDWARAAQSMGE